MALQVQKALGFSNFVRNFHSLEGEKRCFSDTTPCKISSLNLWVKLYFALNCFGVSAQVIETWEWCNWQWKLHILSCHSRDGSEWSNCVYKLYSASSRHSFSLWGGGHPSVWDRNTCGGLESPAEEWGQLWRVWCSQAHGKSVHAHQQPHPSQALGLLLLCALSPTTSICLPSHHCQHCNPRTEHTMASPFLPALSNADPAPVAWSGIAAGSLPDLETDPTGRAAWGPGRPRCPSAIPSKKGERSQSMGEMLNSWDNRLFISIRLCIRGVFKREFQKCLAVAWLSSLWSL